MSDDLPPPYIFLSFPDFEDSFNSPEPSCDDYTSLINLKPEI